MIIVTYKGEDVVCGTLNGLKELSKLGLFRIVEIRDYTENEYWCDTEGYEVYTESFTIRIKYEGDAYKRCGMNFVSGMIKGLLDYVSCEIIKDEI